VSDEDDTPRGFRDFLLAVAFALACILLCGVLIALIAALFAR